MNPISLNSGTFYSDWFCKNTRIFVGPLKTKSSVNNYVARNIEISIYIILISIKHPNWFGIFWY